MQNSESNGVETRLKQLEEQARFTLDVLEMASMLGDFQTSINKLSEPSALLQEAETRIGELVRFSATAFYLVEEASSDFCIAHCSPKVFQPELEAEVAHFIESGVFTMAMRENRPIIVYSRDNRFRFVLHVLATTSRTRGMFVGVMPREERNLSGIMLSLLSIVLKHCANAIESFELYRLFRKANEREREFLNSLPVVAFEAGDDGELDWMSKGGLQLLGYTDDEAPVNVTVLVADGAAQQVREAIALCRDSKCEKRLSVQAVTRDASSFTATLQLITVTVGDVVTVRGVMSPVAE